MSRHFENIAFKGATSIMWITDIGRESTRERERSQAARWRSRERERDGEESWRKTERKREEREKSQRERKRESRE